MLGGADGHRVAGGVHPEAGEVAGFDPGAERFDLVLLMFVHLPHPDRDTLVRRGADALAPGGTMLVVGYHPDNATEGSEGVRDPALLFSPEDVIRQISGLRVQRAERLPVKQAVDTIVRAVKPA